MAIAMATGHLGPKFFSQVKANYICSNIGPMGTLAATSQLSVSGNQGAMFLVKVWFDSRNPQVGFILITVQVWFGESQICYFFVQYCAVNMSLLKLKQ